MRLLKRFQHDRSGTNAIEFALLAVPLLLILLGTIEFGRAIWSRHVIQEIAIVGARCVALPEPGCMISDNYSEAAAKAHIMAEASGRGVSLTPEQIEVSRDASCFGSTGFAEVRISYHFETALPGFLVALAGGADFESSSCFPVQAE